MHKKLKSERKQHLSVDEFAGHSGLSAVTVRRRIRDGSLPHYQPGGAGTKILIPADALETARRQGLSDSQPDRDDAVAVLDADRSIAQTNPQQEQPDSPRSGPKPRWQR